MEKFKNYLYVFKETYLYYFTPLVITLVNIGLFVAVYFTMPLLSSFTISLLVFISIIGMYQFWKHFRIFPKIYKVIRCINNVGKDDYLTIACGVPGTGKTRSEVYLCGFLSQIRWRELKYEYWRKKLVSEFYNKDSDSYLRWQKVEKAYNFFKENEDKYIPCLFSNVKIKDRQGRICYHLTNNHIEQRSPLPIYSILLKDEMAKDYGVDWSKLNEKTKPIDLIARLVRQWGLDIHGTEQDHNQISILWRRRVHSNKQIVKKSESCKPYLLCKYYDFLNSYYKLRYPIACPRKADKKLSRLERLCNSIGFITFKCCITGSTEAIDGSTKSMKFTLTRKMLVTYDTYACSELSPVNNEEIELKNCSWNNINSMKTEIYDLENEEFVSNKIESKVTNEDSNDIEEVMHLFN